MNLKRLSEYTIPDVEKKAIINSILDVSVDMCDDMEMAKLELCCLDAPSEENITKYCPKCGQQYPSGDLFCFKCAVSLKHIKDIDVSSIRMNPSFEVRKSVSYDCFADILTDENLERIADFSFTVNDLNEITRNIKVSALKRLDGAIKDNEILLDRLSLLDKITLFAKSFVDVEYKSYGPELGYFEFSKIHIDDRQQDILQITTIIHELSHFLLKEILTHSLCHVLDCDKTTQVESIALFILSYSPVSRLIDEYAAHTVEGRFTLFGYQDYSSYLAIEKTIDLPPDEIEMIKTIANSFAGYIKDILESFIDDDMLSDIKDKFETDIRDAPDYRNLALENCTLLNDTGMIQAIQFILHDGFAVSMDNLDKLNEYNGQW